MTTAPPIIRDSVSTPPQRISRAQASPRELTALAIVLLAAAFVYVWHITVSGWGNTYYAAAAQAGTSSWDALLFGASDPGGSITVDKPPASIWVMAVSAKLFGLSPLSILLPQAFIGTATVAVVWATTRRVASAPAALTAALIMATTPVAAVVFRYNNPDALLTLLIAGAVFTAVEALRSDRCRWFLVTGALIGLAFLTKQLQALLVLPAIALTLGWKGRGSIAHRVGRLTLGASAILVAAGWWVALITFVPASARPYVGGSPHNSFLELTFGYNGVGRIIGGSGNGSSGIHGGALTRMLVGESGLGVGWLLPGVLVLAGIAICSAPRASRNRPASLALTLNAGVLLTSALAFSIMGGIYHSYYTAALVPALAVSGALAGFLLWERRSERVIRVLIAADVAGTAMWSFTLLVNSGSAVWWFGVIALALGCAATVALISTGRQVQRAGAIIAVTALLLGPAVATFTTVHHAFSGSNPAASLSNTAQVSASPLTRIDPQIISALTSGTRSYRWSAATVGSRPAAQLQLESGTSVMPIGGYRRSDPSPTLVQFQAYVAAGEIHWYVDGAQTGTGDVAEIKQWVSSNFAAQHIGSNMIFDLSQPPATTTSALARG